MGRAYNLYFQIMVFRRKAKKGASSSIISHYVIGEFKTMIHLKTRTIKYLPEEYIDSFLDFITYKRIDIKGPIR